MEGLWPITQKLEPVINGAGENNKQLNRHITEKLENPIPLLPAKKYNYEFSL